MKPRALVCLTDNSPGTIVYQDNRPLPECVDGQTKAQGVWFYAEIATAADVQQAMAIGAAAALIAAAVAAALLKTVFAQAGKGGRSRM